MIKYLCQLKLHYKTRMGCTPSCTLKVAPGIIGPAISKSIDHEIKKDAIQYKDTIKILLLGEGDSGKSTITKQMRILHSNGYSDQDLQAFKRVVHSNTVHSLITIINAMQTLDISFEEKSSNENAKLFLVEIQKSQENEITPALGMLMKSLWHDKGIQHCYMMSNKYQLIESAGYFLNQLDTISSLSYVPTEQDVLRTRARTLGIVETRFLLKNLRFRMVDVGGQRAHRKKWIHCFEGVAAMIFCVALSGYDRVLEEDGKTNRMQESLQLFDAMYHSKWFVRTAIILLLNKRDIFADKIQHHPLTICFPEYPGRNTYESATTYIQDQFEEVRYKNHTDKNTEPKWIYTHFTCATDTPSIEVIFDSVSDIAIQTSIEEMGLI